MKIGFLVNDISNIGGVERVVSVLANNLANRENYEVTIISMFEPKYEKITFQFNNNVKIINLNYKEIWNGIFSDIKYQKQIFNESIIDLDLDILLTLYTTTNLVIAKMKKKLKFKTIACQHGQYHFDGKKINVLKWIYYRKLDKLVLLTHRDEKKYRKFCKNISVIQNPIPFKREYKFDVNNRKILFVGRLSEEKSVDYLIKAFDIVSKKNNSWKLEIVGDGPKKRELESLVKYLSLEEKVIFDDFTNDVVNKYSNSGFTVLTSQSEALPMMLIESKALGIPSISFDIATGPREIIVNSEDGFLVNKNNINELAEKINILINDNELRNKFSRNAYRNSIKYDEKNIVEKWIDIFNSMLGKIL